MDIVKDIADIMRKYKNRHWKVSIDNLTLTFSIQPDIADYDEYCDNWIKIVYEYCQFDECKFCPNGTPILKLAVHPF